MKKWLISTSALIGFVVPAVAQEASSAKVEEVIVTTRRVAERLSEIPLAVSAYSGQGLRDKNIADIYGLSRSTPGVNITPPSQDPYTPVVAIRGQVQSDVSLPNFDSSAGFYIDEYYIARPSGIFTFGYFDLAQIEVTRGPQGTLFGRNATGGNLRYIPNKAANEVGGYVRAAYGRFNHVEAEAALNVPIVKDKLALRVAGLGVRADGYGKSLTTGRESGDIHSQAMRANIIAKPNDALTIDLTYFNFWGHNGNQVTSLTSVVAPVVALFGGTAQANQALALKYDSLSTVPRRAKSRNQLYLAKANYDFSDNLHFGLIYGHFNTGTYQLEDLAPLGFMNAPVDTDVNSRQDSVEGRLSGESFDNRLKWQGGVYWLKETGNTYLTLFIPAFAAVKINANDAANKSVAGFGQATYKVTEEISLTGGLRYTHDDRSTTGTALGAGNACGINFTNITAYRVGPCTLGAVRKDNYVSYLASLDYKITPENLVYVKTARSYRGGGWNPRGVDQGTWTTYKPEKVTEYEIGYKGSLFDNRFKLNLTGFMDQRRFGQASQVIINPISGLPDTTIGNVINTDVYGVETEVAAVLTDNFSIDGTLSHLNKVLRGSPQTKWTAGISYVQAVGPGDLHIRLDYTWQDTTLAVESTGAFDPAIMVVPSFGLLNARIAYTLSSGLEFAVYGRNLTDKYYINGKTDYRPIPATFQFVGQPREVGGEIKYSF